MRGAIMKTADEMIQYCYDNGTGEGFNTKQMRKHFELAASQLGPNEEATVCFIGLHNFVSMTNHANNFAYVVTTDRIIMAQKKVIGQTVKFVNLNNLNDITMSTGLVFGTLTFDTLKETFNVGVNKSVIANIHNLVSNFVMSVTNKAEPISESDPYEELKKAKELLDSGIISQEDFDAKKNQLLGI